MRRFVAEIYNVDDIFSELEEARKLSREKDVSAVLVHVWLGIQGRYLVNAILDELEHCFPKAMVLGCSSGGEIHDGRLTDPAILISVSIFYETEICLRAYPIALGREEELGEEIRRDIDATPGVKAVELAVDTWALDVPTLLSSIGQCSQKVKIFGSAPFAHDLKSPMFVFSSEGVQELATIVVTYAGEGFHITTDYAVGWKPLGVQMRITQASGKTLCSIDGRPALDVYERYLKISNDERFFDNAFEFPLMLYSHDVYVLRIPAGCNEDGSFEMVAAIPEGTSAYMSYGDPETILSEVDECRKRVAKFHPEQIFLYSCAVRKAFWKRSVNNEMKPFQRVAPSSGFFTGGELLRVNGELLHFNATLLVIGMREGDPGQDAILSEASDRQEDTSSGGVSLVRRMATFITEAMKELQEKNAQMEKAAITDELTQLFNRREMNRLIARCLEEEELFSLVMLDIDDFKKVNDTYGHDVGDAVLRDISGLIRDSVAGRDDAVAGRWGGEEFMILLPGMDRAAAATVAEELRKAVKGRAFDVAGSMTISIGVVDSLRQSQMHVLYRDVDAALYEAKRSGKDRVVVKTREAPSA